MSLDLESERFAASGGIDGRAARRAMGKPDMAFWDLFLRETLQNSWDAKVPGSPAISFSVDAIRFTFEQRAILQADVFAEYPPFLHQFAREIMARPIDAIVVSDTGTNGLGGVTRADTASVPGEPRDYVDFVRNVGRDSAKTLGGGTYGFGKGVLYDASRISTCLMYSQVRVGDSIVNRLVVSSVGELFEMGKSRYTGRHWWGVAEDDGVVEPLTGSKARALAQSLGLTRLAEQDTGTAICILDPNTESESAATEISQIVQASLRWAWPHMLEVGNGPSIQFDFTAHGEKVELPHPTDDPSLQHFARAYEKAVTALVESEQIGESWPWTTRQIVMQRPQSDLGVLAYRRHSPDGESEKEFSHHIALMRDPRFIVKYLPISEDPSGASIAGVFITKPEANDVFAKSEPVAHDDWIPSSGRSPVRVALNAIRDEFKAQVVPLAEGVGNDRASGVAHVSRLLGGILAGAEGPGVEIQRSASKERGTGRRTRSGLSVSLGEYPVLSNGDGGFWADFPFAINASDSAELSSIHIDVVAKVVLDGGAVEAANDGPSGEPDPEIIGWFADNRMVSEGASVLAASMVGENLFVRVRQPPHMAVTIVMSMRAPQ